MFGHTWPFLPSGNEPSGATTIEDQELPGCLAGEWLNEYQMQITPQESHVQSDRAPKLANIPPVWLGLITCILGRSSPFYYKSCFF